MPNRAHAEVIAAPPSSRSRARYLTRGPSPLNAILDAAMTACGLSNCEAGRRLKIDESCIRQRRAGTLATNWEEIDAIGGKVAAYAHRMRADQLDATSAGAMQPIDWHVMRGAVEAGDVARAALETAPGGRDREELQRLLREAIESRDAAAAFVRDLQAVLAEIG